MFTCVLYISKSASFNIQWLSKHSWLIQHPVIVIFDGTSPISGLPKEISLVHHQHQKGVVTSIRLLFNKIQTPYLLFLRAGTNITEQQFQEIHTSAIPMTGFGYEYHLSDACLFLSIKEIAPLWSKIHPMLQWGYGARLTSLLIQQGHSWTSINAPQLLPKPKQSYLAQQMANILFHELDQNTLHVQEPWYTPQTEKVSIVILVWNRLDITMACVKSILRNTKHPFELIIVDNGSKEPVGEWVRKNFTHMDHIIYHRNDVNQGFPQGCNDGMGHASGEHIVLLNNDTIVTPYWLCRQVAAFCDPNIGIVGPVSRETSEFQNVFDVLHFEQLPKSLQTQKPFSSLKELIQFSFSYTLMMLGEKQPERFIAGLCMVIRKEVWQKIGGMDACYGFGNCEDTDYCIRTKRLGYRVEVLRDIFIDHIRSSTFSSSTIPYDILIFQNIIHSHYKHFPVHQAQDIIDSCTSTRELLGSRVLWENIRPFDEQQDVIPFHLQQILNQKHPNPPFDPQKTILCLPPLGNMHWIANLESKISDRWNIIIYLDPPMPAQYRQIEELLKHTSIHPDRLYLWKDYVPTTQRGLLYSCASGLLKLERFDWFRLEREAHILELPIYNEITSIPCP